jgi:hypothetical protein
MVCTHLDDSLSPSDLAVHKESISSIKTMLINANILVRENDFFRGMKKDLGFASRAISNMFFTNLSDSPCHFDTRSDDDIAKKVLSASVATAFAR